MEFSTFDSIEKSSEFEPLINRDQSTKITPNQALFILIKALIGAGLLSLPLAFKYSGLWLGLFLLAIISIANFHCIRLLVIAEQFYCQTYNIPTLDYGNVARLALLSGPEKFRLLDNKARVFVNVLIYTINIGLCVVYVVFTATNFKQVFETEFEIFLSLRIWIILSLPIMVLIGSVRSLKVISFLSLCCALLYMSSLIILFAYLIHDLPAWQRLPTVGSLKDLPLYFGITMNAFECTTAILPITNKMAEPHAFLSWNGVLNTGFIFGTTLYGFAGFFGYLKTGQNAEPTITLNLPNEWYYQIVKIMFVIAVWGSYVIQFYVPIYHAEEWIDENILHENDRKRTIVKRATRYGLVLLTIFLAFFIPNISLVLSLIGSFTMTLAVLIIPSIIDLLHAYAQDQSITYWHYAKNIGILIFALIGMISGTYSSIRDILNEMF